MSKSSKNMENKTNRSKGYSLLELMVSVGIMAIIAAAAGPAMQNYIAKQQMRTLAQEIIDSLMLVRSEALSNGVSYELVAQGGDWNNGWESFAYNIEGKELFKKYDISNSSLPIKMIEGDTSRNAITFDGNGRIGSLSRLEITYSKRDDIVDPYCITVARSGNIEVDSATCGGL